MPEYEGATHVVIELLNPVFHLHVHVIPRGAGDGLPAAWPWIEGGDS